MKKKLVGLVLFAILFTIFTEKVCASTDINSFAIDVETTTGIVVSSLNIKVNGEFEENALYYAKFVNEADAKPTDFPENWSDHIETDRYKIESWKTILHSSLGNYGQISIAEDWYLLNGYNYVYILKCTSNSCIISDNPIKIERETLPELSKRYQLYLFSDELGLNIYPYFPYNGKNGSHKLNLKIGIINDKDILYKIYKNETDALESLMNYAKNNSGKSYSCNDSNCSDVNIPDLNINNGSYYYLYTTYENEDGMYRDLSDISIAQAYAGVLSNDINWDFDSNNNNTNEVKNPKTMDKNILLIAGLSVAMLLGVTLSIKKLKKLYK